LVRFRTRDREGRVQRAAGWAGGDNERVDAAAYDAINGVLGLVDIRGEGVNGEGARDNAPGLLLHL